jgi:hypothetical protein
VGDLVEVFLAVDREVKSLGQILPDKAIEVFVSWSLPGAIRGTQVNRHAQAAEKFLVTRHIGWLPARVHRVFYGLGARSRSGPFAGHRVI